jgi:hypothetical protein
MLPEHAASVNGVDKLRGSGGRGEQKLHVTSLHVPSTACNLDVVAAIAYSHLDSMPVLLVTWFT